VFTIVLILSVCTLFSLAQKAQEKSLAKKKRRRRVSLVATSDQRSARWIGGRFLKKATEKLSTRFAFNRSLNQNMN
jgi:hypothetical protein